MAMRYIICGFIFGLVFCGAECKFINRQKQCIYNKFTSATMATILRQEKSNMEYMFESVTEAKKACTGLTSCSGIVEDRSSPENLRFKLASGFPTITLPDTTLWVKECNVLCTFVKRLNSETGEYFFDRECSKSNRSARNVAFTGNWSFWGPWGSCSQSCGTGGTQMRSRYCIPSTVLKSAECNGINEEFRKCNAEKRCVKRVTELYGVTGPEGLVFAGKTTVYRSCVHREASERIPCQGETKLTKDKCNQFKCCFQDYTGQGREGPNCFEAQSFIGSNGRLGWAVWNSWSYCSVTCNNGERFRQRLCTGDLPGSSLCPGSDTEVGVCSLGQCPCDAEPCRNGGECIVNDRVMSGYKCRCAKGFAGKKCIYAEPKLTCEDDFISVSFEKGIVIDDGLIADPKLIQFNKADSSECFAKQQGSMFMLALPPPIDKSCGSELQLEADRMIIRNKVLWRLSDNFVHATVVIVDITCVYNKQVDSIVGLGFGIVPTVRTISEREITEAFDAEMFIYRDASFLASHRYRTSPKIAQGELLYLSIDLKSMNVSDYDKMTVLAEECSVTDPTADRNVVHDLITDGCSTNPVFTTVLSNGISKKARWALRVFDWKYKGKDSGEVYIQCRVRVCLKNCEPKCRDPTTENRNTPAIAVRGSARKRRSIDNEDNEESDKELQRLLSMKIIIN